MTEQVKRAAKPKRKLSNINFQKEGGHVALVSKDQGGPANGHDYALVIKANNFSEEFVQKIQQVKVTMELPDFLKRFFYLYGDDADVLAAMMGYVEPVETAQMEAEEAKSEMQDWIESRMSAFEIIKAAYESENIAGVLSKLTQEQYLSLVTDQEMLEKAFMKIDEKKIAEKPTVTTVEKSIEIKPEPAGSTTVNKESTMDETVEMIAKSAFVDLQKTLDEQKVELQKALDLVKVFEEEKKAVIAKARKAEVVAAVKDEAKAEVLFKAVKDASDEDFQAVVKALTELTVLVEKSSLFTETGVSTDVEPEVKESAIAKAVKANLKK